jgi:hypothetical protein
MERKIEKLLWPIAICLLIFILILLIDYYIVGSVIGASIMIVGALGTWRKPRIETRIIKLSIVMIAFFVLTNPAPQYWLTQFERRWMDNRTKLIEPNHPIMNSINASFQNWYLNRTGYEFAQETDFEKQVRAVDEYIRLERFHYQYDQDTYQGYYDHLPTIDEILQSEDSEGKWRDDCDGISIMTASFLIYLGFKNTYISEVTYHYHTMVFRDGDDPKTIEGYYRGISLYRGLNMQENDKISYYLFNQTEVFVPPARPLPISIGEILVDGSFWKYEFVWIFDGEMTGMPLWVNIILMFAISQVMGIGLVAYTHAGLTSKLQSSNLKRKQGTQLSLIAGFSLFIMFIINYLIVEFAFLCNPILMLTFASVLIFLEKKING